MKFGNKLIELREQRGLSQEELADELRVSRQTISNWENDNIQPSVEMLVRIAKYFGTSTDYLLDLDTQDRFSVSGLTEQQTAHIKLLIEDLKKANSRAAR